MHGLLFPTPLAQPPREVIPMEGSHPAGSTDFFLPNYWCLHFYRYHAELTLNGHALHIRPGMVGLIPPGWPIRYHWTHRIRNVCAHFQLPQSANSEVVQLPALLLLEEGFDKHEQELREMIPIQKSQPTRVAAWVWTFLWKLKDISQPAEPARDSIVRNAIHRLNLKIEEPIRISEIARHVEVSHNHLIRLFRSELGMTPQQYLTRLRVQRAEHLLARTTQPIQSIAVQVGLPDLQKFNKLIRRHLGAAPRKVREHALGNTQPTSPIAVQ